MKKRAKIWAQYLGKRRLELSFDEEQITFTVEAARFGPINNASLKPQIDASYM